MDKRTIQAAGSALSFSFGMGLQVSGYQNIYLAGACFGFSAVLALYLIIGIWRRPRFVPMPKAAALLYEESRKAGNVLAFAAERLGAKGSSGSAEGRILDYLAAHIARKIPVYGVRPPSKAQEVLSLGAGTFRSDASEFWKNHSQSATFTGLKVRRSDLIGLIASQIGSE